jgi:hypothetical protein
MNDLALHLIEPSIPLADFSKTKQPTIALAPDALKPYVGIYVLSPTMDLTVTMRDGKLFAQATGQSEFELFAKSERVFFAKVTPLEIHFDPANDAGVSAQFVLHQGGARLAAKRK